MMDMQNFFHWDEFLQFQDVNLFRLLIGFSLSAGLSWLLTILYKKTYRGTGYSQAMSHSLILLSCIVALVMVVIGSNIARAFSLVGALSIIRFRTAVKNTRDTTFIFLTLAIGMAAGSRFYLTAIVSTVLFSGLILLLYYTDMGKTRTPMQMLRIRLPGHLDAEMVLVPVLNDFLMQWDIVAQETTQLGTAMDITYQVQLQPDVTQRAFLEQLRTVNENQRISLFHPDREVSL